MDSGVKYARSDGIHIAYRVFGDGPRDIVLIPGTLSHVELFWEFPPNEYLLKRFMSFARVIVFDKRGQGLSDRVAEQTIEERIGDVRAVMDAAGSKKATIYGWSEGGAMSLLFAATYPERTSGLVLCGSFASYKAYVSEERRDLFLKRLDEHWGEVSWFRLMRRPGPRMKCSCGTLASSSEPPPVQGRSSRCFARISKSTPAPFCRRFTCRR